jgi:hypothetical protein
MPSTTCGRTTYAGSPRCSSFYGWHSNRGRRPSSVPTPVAARPERDSAAALQIRCSFAATSAMGREGFEPSTLGLRVPCSTS